MSHPTYEPPCVLYSSKAKVAKGKGVFKGYFSNYCSSVPSLHGKSILTL